MNFEQLEQMRELATRMRAVLKTDESGSADIKNSLEELQAHINNELKEYLWRQYEEEHK